MNFFDVIHSRRSVREYTGEAIRKEDLEKIIDAARMAPSGGNRQPWHFVMVTEKHMVEKIASHFSTNFAQSGAFVAVVLDEAVSKWCLQDGSAAIENMMLAATALGIGSCWLEGTTQRSEGVLKSLLNIPEAMKLQTMISLGVPVEWPTHPKKSLAEVLHWEKF